ncbi:MAG: hypothetical protein N3G19_02000 [Candidatus Pacearchaeota archaeon]|nr:hypothetical protein [Candidatus Pacearchaeota archaeon]
MLETKIEGAEKETEKGTKKDEERCVWRFYAINYWNKDSPITQKCLNCDAYNNNCPYYKSLKAIQR